MGIKIKVVNPEGDNIGIGAAFAREIGGKFIAIMPFNDWYILDNKG